MRCRRRSCHLPADSRRTSSRAFFGPARAPDQRQCCREGEVADKATSRERDQREAARTARTPSTISSASPKCDHEHAGADAHSLGDSTSPSDGKARSTAGRFPHQHCRRGDAGPASGNLVIEAGRGCRSIRDLRIDRRRHRAPGNRERQHHSTRPRSPKRASPMAAAPDHRRAAAALRQQVLDAAVVLIRGQ